MNRGRVVNDFFRKLPRYEKFEEKARINCNCEEWQKRWIVNEAKRLSEQLQQKVSIFDILWSAFIFKNAKKMEKIEIPIFEKQ